MNKISNRIKTPRPGTGTGKPIKYPPVDFSAALKQPKAPPQVKPKRKGGKEEIDFSAALDPALAPALYINNNTLVNSNRSDIKEDSDNNKIKLKDQLTDQEIDFLEIYLGGNITIESAMIEAGYTNVCTRSRHRIASNIVQKYERGARGAREVMRKCGVGEVRVAKKIDGLMEDPSSRTQLGATELAARILSMTQEQRGPTQGIQIIINTAPAVAPGGAGPGPPTIDVQERKQLPPPTKPLQITK